MAETKHTLGLKPCPNPNCVDGADRREEELQDKYPVRCATCDGTGYVPVWHGHTLGPWKVSGDCIYGADDALICRCFGLYYLIEAYKANTKLIASAPDLAAKVERLESEKAGLLKALEKSEQFIRDSLEASGSTCDHEANLCVCDDLKLHAEVVAVIDKAKGAAK